MIVKECFGCGKVTAHRHLRACVHEIAETHIAGSERFICELCEHTTFADSEGASRFPFAPLPRARRRERAPGLAPPAQAPQSAVPEFETTAWLGM